MTKKHFLTLVVPTFLTASTLLSSACKNNENNYDTDEKDKIIQIKLNEFDWLDNDKKQEYFNKFKLKAEEKKLDYSFKFSAASSNDSENLKDTLNNKNIISFPAITKYYVDKEFYEDKIQVFTRTYTNAFKNNLESLGYENGKNDYLIKQAENQNKLFEGYESWDLDSEWNGSFWPKLYEEPSKKTVAWQRGSILIWGDEVKRNEIKGAWKNKDWEKFRSFGIIHGSEDSGSKYILPQALLKKHFKDFKTLKEEITNNTNKFSNAKASEMTKQKEYHIGFDNEMGFAWTKNNKGRYIVSDADRKAGYKLEILTLTDAIPYNIGVASSNIKNDDLKIIVDIFKELKAEDNYVMDCQGFTDFEFLTKEKFNNEVLGMCKKAEI